MFISARTIFTAAIRPLLSTSHLGRAPLGRRVSEWIAVWPSFSSLKRHTVSVLPRTRSGPSGAFRWASTDEQCAWCVPLDAARSAAHRVLARRKGPWQPVGLQLDRLVEVDDLAGKGFNSAAGTGGVGGGGLAGKRATQEIAINFILDEFGAF